MSTSPSKEALFLQLLWQEFEDRMKCLERQASLCPLRSFADLLGYDPAGP